MTNKENLWYTHISAKEPAHNLLDVSCDLPLHAYYSHMQGLGSSIIPMITEYRQMYPNGWLQQAIMRLRHFTSLSHTSIRSRISSMCYVCVSVYVPCFLDVAHIIYT